MSKTQTECFVGKWQIDSFGPKKKNCLFPSECLGEIFFPVMQLVNFFKTTNELKKILNRKRKLRKKKEEK